MHSSDVKVTDRTVMTADVPAGCKVTHDAGQTVNMIIPDNSFIAEDSSMNQDCIFTLHS